MNKIPFTKAGFDALQLKRDELLQKRPDAVSDLKRAREMGDLSENGFYKGARAKLSQIDSQLRHLNNLIKSAEVINKNFSGKVDIGCAVVLKNKNETRGLQIVGSFEANPLENKISNISPFGKMLLGKKEGDKVVFGETAYTLISVKKN